MTSSSIVIYWSFSILFPATTFLVNAQSYLQFGPNGMPSSGDCFKDFQYLQKRFSWEQLQFFCQQWRSYSELVYENATIVTEFTANQLTYIRSLSVNLNATSNSSPMTVRKEYRTLSENERNLFHFVLRSLKQQKIDGVSKYDLLVQLSNPTLAPGAHVGAAFLLWHREYLRTFEAAMQKINTFASLPYWNPTFDQGLPNAADSILWEPNFLGNGDGPVMSGPFAGWVIQSGKRQQNISKETTEDIQENFLNESMANYTQLTRNISNGNGRLMTPDDVQYILTRKEFRQFSACLDLRLEQTSRYVHEWVGGSMADLHYSAEDPLFFLFHAYLDSLFEEWRRNATYEQRVYGYPPNFEACTKFHYASSPMKPFEPLINFDGLSDAYTRLYYTYQADPACTEQNPHCLSSLLFCDRTNDRCLSKIRPDGDCAGMEAFDPCYQSLCVDGRCVKSTAPLPAMHLLPANETMQKHQKKVTAPPLTTVKPVTKKPVKKEGR